MAKPPTIEINLGTVCVVIREDNESRPTSAGSRPVLVRTVMGVYACLDDAKEQGIPHWADKERTSLRDNELFASGDHDIEFVVEEWAVRG